MINKNSKTYILKKIADERTQFYECLRTCVYTMTMAKSGTFDWSSSTYNLKKGTVACPNDCKYCYIKTIDRRFKRNADFVIDIENLVCDTEPKKVTKNWRKVTDANSKYIMMPSSHDIFDNNVHDICVVTEKMIDAGHDVLLVSKPRLSCIRYIINYFDTPKSEFAKRHIDFKLTIGSHDNTDIRFWEGNAPLFEERFECVKLLHSHGYTVGISSEPLLTTDPVRLFHILEPYINSIWFGEMNYSSSLFKVTTPEDELYLGKLKTIRSQFPSYIKQLMCNDKVYWKTGVFRYCHDHQIKID